MGTSIFENIIVTNVIVPRLFTKTILQDLPAEKSDENFENIKIGIIMKCWRNSCVKQARMWSLTSFSKLMFYTF